MDTVTAMARAAAARGNKLRVFDWDRAAQRIAETRPEVASAGLGEDWEWTGGEIYRDGDIIPRSETYTYLASNWAIPELDMDGEVEPCWKYADETPGWDHDTYWPETALATLNS